MSRGVASAHFVFRWGWVWLALTIQSAIAQKMTVSFQPDPTPVNELALAPGDFVVVVTV